VIIELFRVGSMLLCPLDAYLAHAPTVVNRVRDDDQLICDPVQHNDGGLHHAARSAPGSDFAVV
jgi:hypothetical protein